MMALGACVYCSRSHPYFLLYRVRLGLQRSVKKTVVLDSKYCPPSLEAAVNDDGVVVATGDHLVAAR